MTISNYPAGVTGAEYAIAGPDSERDGTAHCEQCGQEREGLIQSYGADRWLLCDSCGETTALGWPEPDWDWENDNRPDVELDREYGS